MRRTIHEHKTVLIMSFLIELSRSLSQKEIRKYVQMHLSLLIEVSIMVTDYNIKVNHNHTTVTDQKPSFEFIKSTFVQASDLLFNELTLCFTLICFIGQINRWFVYPYNCTFQSFSKSLKLSPF